MIDIPTIITGHNNQCVLVAALIEAGVPYDKILNLVVKYCGCDRIQAENIYMYELRLYTPARSLIDYLVLNKGWSDEAAYDYYRRYAEKHLKKDEKLSKLSGEKLYAQIEKLEMLNLSRH